MKLKLDENLPVELAGILIAFGHDVHTVSDEGLEGRDDATIFASALAEDRLLVTQDLDFSDARQFALGTHPGVMPLRLRTPSRRRILARLQDVLASHSLDAWARCFVVVSD